MSTKPVKEIARLLSEIEQHCPCGARPESPNTHPHVGGCPVEAAIQQLTALRTALAQQEQEQIQADADHEGLLQCRALLDVQEGDNLYDAITRMKDKLAQHVEVLRRIIELEPVEYYVRDEPWIPIFEAARAAIQPAAQEQPKMSWGEALHQAHEESAPNWKKENLPTSSQSKI